MNTVLARAVVLFAVGLMGCTVQGLGPDGGPSGVGGGGGPIFPGDSGPIDGCFPGGGGFGGTGGSGGGGPQFIDSPVVEPARPPPAITGGTLAVLADDSIVVADPDRDLVYLVSADNQLVMLTLQTGDEPGRVIQGPRNRVFVALRRAGQVLEVDMIEKAIVARHDVCQLPRGLGWSSARQTLYVACATGELTELTFDGSTVVAAQTEPVAEDLRDVVVADDGVVLSTFRNAQVFKRSHDRRKTAWPSPARETVVGNFGRKIDFDARVAWRMVPMSSGGALMVYQRAIVNLADELRCSSTSYGGGNTTGIVFGAVAQLSATGAVQTHLIREAVLPVDIAQSLDGTQVAIVAAGSGTVLSLRGDGTSVRVGLGAGAQPTAVGYRSNGLLVAFSREPATLIFANPNSPGTGVPAALPLGTTSVKSTGHEIFHAATSNQIACASCHPEAGEDGHTWILPEGKRRTPSLRGGLIGTTPFHWAGDLKDIKALMSEVLTRRMGGNIQNDARMDAELKWLDAQPALPAPKSLDAAAVARGSALFASPAVGCLSCHSGALGTNNANSTVGTGLSLQVPRLVELSYRAPFFHDGRVPTLAARFTPVGGGDAHGHVSQLKPAEVADLVAYLKSR